MVGEIVFHGSFGGFSAGHARFTRINSAVAFSPLLPDASLAQTNAALVMKRRPFDGHSLFVR